MCIHTEQGYKDRRDYINSLADDLDVPRKTAFAIADILGPDEDFDGLVTTLEDYSE